MTAISAGSTMSIAMSANRMPVPAMNPNWLNPRKSAATSTYRAIAVVRAPIVMACPVLANVVSAASDTDSPSARSSE